MSTKRYMNYWGGGEGVQSQHEGLGLHLLVDVATPNIQMIPRSSINM